MLQSYGPVIRRDLARALGICGVLAYNWWILVPILRPGLLHSPNELFSNLEVTGQPFATVIQRADLLSGLLMLAAFVAAGSRNVKAGRPDWLGMMIFSIAGVAGGLFHETCADAISKSCRELEVGLRLPAAQYLHIGAGVVEFGSITAALAYAVYRTRQQQTPSARTYRVLGWAAIAAYPLLGLAYLTSRLGALVEALFFIGFCVMVIAELLERTQSARPLPDRRRTSQPTPVRHDGAPKGPGNFFPFWTQASVNGTCVWEFGNMSNGNSFGGVAQYGKGRAGHRRGVRRADHARFRRLLTGPAPGPVTSSAAQGGLRCVVPAHAVHPRPRRRGR